MRSVYSEKKKHKERIFDYSGEGGGFKFIAHLMLSFLFICPFIVLVIVVIVQVSHQ